MADEKQPLLTAGAYQKRCYSTEKRQNKLENNEQQLNPTVNTGSGVLLSAGLIIGSGIFVTSNEVLASVNGSIGLSLLAWLGGGLVAMLSTLCYCELATSIRESGSDYTYLRHAYGPALAFLLPSTITFVPTSDAITALTFSKYLVQPFFKNCDAPVLAVKLFAAVMILLLTTMNCYSAKVSVRAQVIFTSAKILTILAILVGSVVSCVKDYTVAEYNYQNLFNKQDIDGIGFSKVSRVLFQVTWPYQGWHALCYMTEEIKNPAKTLPRASISSLLIVILLYLTINVAFLLVLTPEQIISSTAIVTTFSNKVFSRAPWFTSLIVCLCAAGSYSAGIVTQARMTYVAARHGHLPKILGMLAIHNPSPTPVMAIFVRIVGALILIIIGDFDKLLVAFGFFSWIFLCLSSASVLVLRKRKPFLERPYKVPAIIPVIVIIIGSSFAILTIATEPNFLYLYGLSIYLLELVMYNLFIVKKYKMPSCLSLTLFLQKLLKISS
ncbi:b(0,+)-type amino acid transporter 1-like isoform X1 [Clavelina lepadiformis]|uniref:b(0,+)-type amino acid transporter 1-like isoform X1 n=1 Tax=Clavelina lepadiformis TaxID=159417 RepID=UPI004042FA74